MRKVIRFFITFTLVLNLACANNDSEPTDADSPIRASGGTNDAGSFINGTEVTFKAYKNGTQIIIDQWTADNAIPQSESFSSEFSPTANFPSTNYVSRGTEVSITITAKNAAENFNASIPFYQHNIDGLRQEYIDFYVNTSPGFYSFDQTNTYPYPFLVFTPDWDDSPNKSKWDVESWHQWWIVSDLLYKVQTVDLYYINPDYIIWETSGYRCPAGNYRVGGKLQSLHMQGKAFDWNQGNWGLSDASRTEENYKVFAAVKNTNFLQLYLYDQYDIEYDYTQIPQWPQKPPGVTIYTHGHAAW